LISQQRNKPWRKVFLLRGLNDHGELHGRFFHFDGGFRVFVLGAVYDVGPFNQFRYGSRIKSKTVLRDSGQKLSAGLEVWIVELLAALAMQEVFVIFRSKKRALMMVEPPGNFWRGRILKIHDRVLIAGEVFFVEERSGAMQQSAELKRHVVANAFRVEAREERR